MKMVHLVCSEVIGKLNVNLKEKKKLIEIYDINLVFRFLGVWHLRAFG